MPEIILGETPCFSATAIYIAHNTAAGGFMVMDVETLSRGMPSNRISISASESTATPHFPISPVAN